MATIACPSCTRPLSKAATTCPHCRKPTSAREYRHQMGQCRACRSELRREDHVEKKYYTEIIDGRSRERSYNELTACGECGDPNPFGVIDMARVWAGVILGVIAFIVVGALLA